MVAFLIAASLVAAGASSDEAQSGLAVVHLADGTSVPLRSWALSYEYVAWPQGGSQALAQPARRDAQELWVGKRTFALQGVTLEIEHAARPGAADSGAPPPARQLWLKGAAKPERLSVEPPQRQLLVPDGPKGLVVLPRSLDLRGETITGTRREFCVLSYTTLVECGASPEHRVVKLEFQ
jgi:hypothetical protein